MLASDDDFEPDGDEHGVADEGGSGSDGEDSVNDVDVQLSNEEVDGLIEDAYGKEAYQRRECFPIHTGESCTSRASRSTPSSHEELGPENQSPSPTAW